MKYSNELKVGAAIVLSALIFFLGVRFFEDIPLFRGTYALHTTFDHAGGLLGGNAVRINGVNVGSVETVALEPQTGQVRVRFHLNGDIRVPEGSYASVEGISALNSVTLALHLGPPGNPVIPRGGLVPGRSGEGLLGGITDRAPELVDRVQSVLVGVDTTLVELQAMLQNPQSDVRQTLASIRGTASSAEGLLQAERETIGRVLQNLEQLTADLSAFTGTNADTLGAAVHNLGQAVGRLNDNLASLENTTAQLDALLGKIDQGEGTLGLLVNDPGLYLRLDSTLANLNRLIVGFERNPGRYLRQLRLVDLF